MFLVVLVVMVAGGLWGLSNGLERVLGGSLPEPVEPGLTVDFVIEAVRQLRGSQEPCGTP